MVGGSNANMTNIGQGPVFTNQDNLNGNANG